MPASTSTAGAGGSQGGQAELLLQGIDDLEGLRDRILACSLEACEKGGAEGRRIDEPSGPLLEELRGIRRLLEDFRK